MVGPPGLSINSIIKKTIANNNNNYELFNFGEEVSAIQGSLSVEEKAKFQSCKLVSNDKVGSIVDKIEKYTKSEKNYIV